MTDGEFWSGYCPDCSSPAFLVRGPYDNEGIRPEIIGTRLKCPNYACGYFGPDKLGNVGDEDDLDPSVPWGLTIETVHNKSPLRNILGHEVSIEEGRFDIPLRGLMIREFLEDAFIAGCTLSLKQTPRGNTHLLRWSIEGPPAPSPERFWCKYHLSGPTFYGGETGTRKLSSNRRYSTEEEAIQAYRGLSESKQEGSDLVRCAHCTGFHVIPRSGLEAMSKFREREQSTYTRSPGLCSVITYHSGIGFTCNGNPGSWALYDEILRKRARKEGEKLQDRVKKFQPNWRLRTYQYGLVILCGRCSSELNEPYSRFMRDWREKEEKRRYENLPRWQRRLNEYLKHQGTDGSGDAGDDDEMDEF